MKIKDLDRNEVYDLTEIKKDAVKFDMLKEWLKENDKWIILAINELNSAVNLYYSYGDKEWLLDTSKNTTKCALTLFDLDITGYQVDCTDLSKEQIEEMAEVMLSKGKKYLTSKEFALNRNHTSDFLISRDKVFYITNNQQKTTITYDKFMELFGKYDPVLDVIKATERAFEMQETVNETVKEMQRGVDILDKLDKSMQESVLRLAEAFEENTNDFKQITNSISSLLEYKNKKYGNSALEPLNIFTNKCKVGQRLDDKLARVKNSTDLKKNDVADLIGYLILTCKENGWNNFDEFKD